MKRVGIVGSRTFNDRDFMFDVLDGVHEIVGGEFQIVGGGAQGADLLGAEYAWMHGWVPEIYPARWDDIDGVPEEHIKLRRDGSRYNMMAGFDRNQTIVDNSQVILAFMNPDLPTNGTTDTIEKARKAGKPVFVLYPGKSDDLPFDIFC